MITKEVTTMKRWLCALLAAIMLLGLVLNTFALAEEASGKVKTTGSVNIRSGPGLSYKSLGSVKKGTTLEYQGEKKKDDRGVTWYRVKYKNTTKAWVSSKYSKLTGDSSSSGSSSSGSSSSGSSSSGKDEGYGTVKATAKVNIRKGPGLDYKSLGVVKKGTTLAYQGERYKDERGVNWYRVRYSGTTSAWISSTYAKLSDGADTVKTGSASSSGSSSSSSSSKKTTPAPTNTPKPTPKSSYGNVQITASLNVRLGPGLDYEGIGTVAAGQKLAYHGDSCTDNRGVTWYRVTFDGREDAWVSSKHADLSANSDTVSTGESGMIEGSVEATSNVNLRVGPGTHNDKVGGMKKGESLDYMGAVCTDENGDEWYMVRMSSGKMGWVYADYARLGGAAEPVTVQATPAPVSIWVDEIQSGGESELNWFTPDEISEAAEPVTEFAETEMAGDLAGIAQSSASPWDIEALPEMTRAESAGELGSMLTQEQILSALGVIELSQLNYTDSVQNMLNGETSTIKVGFKEGVFEGGTTGYTKTWSELDGVASASEADLDGDGSNEFIVIYARTVSGETQWSLAVFEHANDAWMFADEIDLGVGDMNERFVRLTDMPGGKALFVGNVNYWDGGSGVIDGVIYSYSLGSIWGEAMFSGTNVSYSYVLSGKKFSVDAIAAIDEACQNYPYRPDEIVMLGIQNGVHFTSHDLGGYKPVMDPVTGKIHAENFAGVDMINTAISAYGAQAGYQIGTTADGTESFALSLGGGEVLMWMDEELEQDGAAFLTMIFKNCPAG